MFTEQFLFQINRVQLETSDRALLVIGIVFILTAILFKLGAHFAPSSVDAKYRNKFFYLFLTVGLLEVVWFGARAQFVRFFGTHFVALVILLIGLVWFGFIIGKMIKHYRREKQEWERVELKKKYLP